MIQRHEGRHMVALMCCMLKVSRTGYYDWRGRAPSDREQANVAADLQRIFTEHKGRAGAPRIPRHLREEGQAVGKNRMARVMQTERLDAAQPAQLRALLLQNSTKHGFGNEPWMHKRFASAIQRVATTE